LDEAKENYEKKIQDNIVIYREMIREKDEKQKETLKFLNSIGFDLIPQGITDEIIRIMNSN